MLSLCSFLTISRKNVKTKEFYYFKSFRLKHVVTLGKELSSQSGRHWRDSQNFLKMGCVVIKWVRSWNFYEMDLLNAAFNKPSYKLAIRSYQFVFCTSGLNHGCAKLKSVSLRSVPDCWPFQLTFNNRSILITLATTFSFIWVLFFNWW